MLTESTSAVLASAMLLIWSVNPCVASVVEWQSIDVGRVIAEMLDDSDLFELSHTSKSFNLLAREMLAMKIQKDEHKWGVLWPGKFIRCNTEREWDEQIKQVGELNERAMIKWMDPDPSMQSCVLLKGVSIFTDSGYTGKFNAQSTLANIHQYTEDGTSPKNSWLTYHDFRGDLLACELDSQLRLRKQLILAEHHGPCHIRADIAVKHEQQLTDGSEGVRVSTAFTSYQFSSEVGIGEVLKKFSLPSDVQFQIPRVNVDADTPRIVYVHRKLVHCSDKDSSLMLKYGEVSLKSENNNVEHSINLSKFSDQCELVDFRNTLSLDGRFIGTYHKYRPFFLITDTHSGKVVHSFRMPLKTCIVFSMEMNVRYCVISLQRYLYESQTNYSFDLVSGEIIGNGFRSHFNHGWVDKELLMISDYGFPLKHVVSVQQPNKKIVVDHGLYNALTFGVVCRLQNNRLDLILGHWQKSRKRGEVTEGDTKEDDSQRSKRTRH